MAKKQQNVNQVQKKRKLNKGRIILSLLLVVAIAIAASGIYLGVKVYSETGGLDTSKLVTTEASTQVSSSTGKTTYTYSTSGTSKNVSYDDLPQVLIDAVVSAEDSRYFEHNGFDLPRIVKAFMGNLVAGRITGGGSTITQQLIKKTYYPDEEQKIERKIGEVILSVQATKQVSKEKILELYLNKIYFGSGPKTVGIYAASKYYFDKSVQNLTLPEAALLAGTLNSPTSYDPFYSLEKAQKRRDIILDLMYTHGYITEEERDKTKAVPVQNTLKSNPIQTGGKYQAYADMVTREVYAKTGMDPNYTGMKIYTYMDEDVQQTLDDIASGKTHTFNDEYLQVGACVQETQHGRIVGVLSGRNYSAMGTTYAYAASKEDVANGTTTQYGQRNQPGSSLKPIISYASAFEFLNYSTAHYVHDIPYSTGKWNPKNWDNKYHGDISIKEALYQSWNLAAINTLKDVVDEVGTDKMTSYLEGFGYDMYGENFDLVYAIGGWSTGVSPKETAGAYATISNGGTYYEPHTVEKIEILATGEVIYLDKQAEENKKRAISEEASFMIREIMTEYVDEGKGQYGVFDLGYQIGAKSGTTNDSVDTWMVGYSPDYSWAVWCGYSSSDRANGRTTVKGHDAREIAVQIAKAVHKDGVKNSYHTPTTVVQAKVVTGIYPYVSPGSNVPSSRITTGWFKEGYEPSSSASASVSMPTLKSFTASASNRKISVEFTKAESSSSGYKTYKVNGKSYSLPYLGDLSSITASVTYHVDVLDSSGTTVHSEDLSSNTGSLNYTPSAGTYTVVGYYVNGDSTSNKISQNVTVKSFFGGLLNIGSSTSNSIGISVEVPEGNSIAISLSSNGAVLKSTNVTYDQSFNFTNLSPSTTYTITAVETTADGESKQIASKTITTAGDSTTEDETTESQDN